MQAQSKSGYIHHVLVSCELIVLGQDSCIMTFIHDITERKQAEDELRALYNATSVLFKADDLTSLGQQIVRAVIDEFKQFDCGLILVDTKQDRLIRLVRSGEQRIETDAPLYRDGAGLVPEAIRSGEMIYVPDVSLDERYLAHEQQTQSELVLPLKTSKGTLGVLDLQSTHKDAFSEGDRRILSTFAERAALALELMALYEEVHRHATELEARVAQRTFELRQSKERVEAIFNNSFDAIALVDAKGLIQQTNLAFDTLFGYSTDALFQHRLTEISDDAHIKILENAIEKVVHSKQSKRLELQAQREDQTQLIVDLALAAVSHDPIAAVYVICSFRDVTERKRLEENLRQTLEKEQELNQMKSRFTAMVSHEFRSPLAVIQSATDILKNYLDRLSDEKKQQYLDRIHGQIKRLTQMVEDVLIIGEAQTLGIQFAPRLLDLESFCRKIVEEIQATTNQHQLRFVATGDGTDMLIDEKLFQQILTNLLSNAVKYSPKGGDIACELICTEKQVVLHVKDTGIGIPEADLEHLFEDFHRAGNVAGITGTGLGLSIVKRAVDAHKGTIQVKSTLGIGTVFTLRLPI
jgi:PAS domain S-box-containing protein